MTDAGLYGVVAEFGSPAALRDAAHRLRLAGFERFETYTPYPVEEIDDRRSRGIALPMIALVGAAAGLLLGYLTQFYGAAIDYPINVGGRPLHSAPAFVPIAFEIMVLWAVAATAVGALVLAGLFRLSHPVENAPGFERASQDRFFLCVEAGDPRFDRDRLHRLLARYAPLSVADVPS
jgi:hypothetical protein